jgi:hypothetical protein
MNGAGELDSVVFITFVGEHLLHDAEQVVATGNGHEHGA